MDPADKIIQSIKEQQLKPTSRWYYRLREGIIWTLFGISIILGAMAFSIILYAIQQADFNLVKHISHSRLELLLAILPFIWIVLMIVGLVLALVSLKNTWRGYKISPLRLVTTNLALSILLGTAFFIGGGGDKLESAFNRTGFDYTSIQERKQLIWSHPEEGMLAGKIEGITNDEMTLTDFGGNTWHVNIDGAFIAPVLTLEPGETVKLTGSQTAEETFRAKEVRPWGGPGNPGSGYPGKGRQ